MFKRFVKIKQAAFNDMGWLTRKGFNTQDIYPVFGINKDKVIVSHFQNGELIELFSKYLIDVTHYEK